MQSDLIQLSFDKIMQTRAYTVVILAGGEKRFAIYTDPQVGKNIQTYLTEKHMPRPFTHDLINSILKGYEIKIVQVVIQDVEDTIYFARLFLELALDGKKSILEIDARPSDCITLALVNNVPVFCRKEILDKAIAVEE